MVLASHCIFTAYGFWLPNDPRGSWSDFVRNWELFRFGEATKISDRCSVANKRHDQHLRLIAKSSLAHEPIKFTGAQARTIASGFGRAIRESDYQVVACAILPEHIHLVCLRHDHAAEQIVGHLKTRATQQLFADGIHPFSSFEHDGRFPSVWARRCWKVFLDSNADINCAIKYVEENPLKEGKPPQKWSFIQAFSGRTCAAGSSIYGSQTPHKCGR